jgi:hypothetical protein
MVMIAIRIPMELKIEKSLIRALSEIYSKLSWPKHRKEVSIGLLRQQKHWSPPSRTRMLVIKERDVEATRLAYLEDGG